MDAFQLFITQYFVVGHLSVDQFDTWLKTHFQNFELQLHRHALVLVDVAFTHLGKQTVEA